MSKNIVICCDGTGQQYGDANSNVVKLFHTFVRDPSLQLCFYDPGVGTFSIRDPLFKWQDLLGRVLGLAFGWGLFRNIEDAYGFLMEQYRPGDRIFIFGFSRGAYTARALAGMLHEIGLLYPEHTNLIEYASRLYRNKPSGQTGWDKHRRIVQGFHGDFCRRCPIHFLGLWDTVKSIGWFWDPFSLRFTTTNPGITIVRHAVSIDERRCFYRQHLWGEPEHGQDIKEVWFAGVHSDVGGSYPERESGLSKKALEWMVREARAKDLQVDGERLALVLGGGEDYVPPDSGAAAHESLHGIWWLAELLPRRYNDPGDNFREKWTFPLLCWRQIGRRRYINADITIHRSVRERMDLNLAPEYAPPNLPGQNSVED